jgi:hypothetical protein
VIDSGRPSVQSLASMVMMQLELAGIVDPTLAGDRGSRSRCVEPDGAFARPSSNRAPRGFAMPDPARPGCHGGCAVHSVRHEPPVHGASRGHHPTGHRGYDIVIGAVCWRRLKAGTGLPKASHAV